MELHDKKPIRVTKPVVKRFQSRNIILLNYILTRNKSIAEFAKRCGYTRSYISGIINGLTLPRQQDIQKMAEVLSEQLGTHVDSLAIYSNEEFYDKQMRALNPRKKRNG